MSGLLLNVWAMGKKKAANEEMLTECQLKQCGARAYTWGGKGAVPLYRYSELLQCSNLKLRSEEYY